MYRNMGRKQRVYYVKRNTKIKMEENNNILFDL